jgi:hypothetical protein
MDYSAMPPLIDSPCLSADSDVFVDPQSRQALKNHNPDILGDSILPKE